MSADDSAPPMLSRMLAGSRNRAQIEEPTSAIAIALAALLTLTSRSAATRKDYFQISVVDDSTGSGVPLVELTLPNAVRYYTDSNGIIAFLEPHLMDREVFFEVRSHGVPSAQTSRRRDGRRAAEGAARRQGRDSHAAHSTSRTGYTA